MRSDILHRLRETRVLENYSYMTALNILSALIGLIIYPYVIRATGKDAFGTYVYAFTIASFFQVLIDYGFDSPGAKAIVQANEDVMERSRIVTSVLLLKTGLIVISGILFSLCLHFIPIMHANRLLCLITFTQLAIGSLFPVWYFQGMKKMKWVTYINLSLRLCTIPLILLFIHSAQDINSYAFIVMISIVLGTGIAYIFLAKDGIRFASISSHRLKTLLSDATPFFATAVTGNLKSLSVKTLIKIHFGVGDVAVYDLAEKIITIPRFFTQNINGALFPEVVNNATPEKVKRIFKYEHLIGIAFTIIIALLSYPMVLILGGEQMMDAVWVTIMLSTTIYTWLVVGAYINFVFIPAGKYYIITLNQLIAFLSCVLLAYYGLFLWQDISVVTAGVMISGFIEMIFCRYISKHYKLL